MKKWFNDRVGFRREHGKDAVHHDLSRWCSRFFEFLKRLALLAALSAAGRTTPWLQIVYFGGIAALVIPIWSWFEQWNLDVKTRNPKRFDPRAGELPPRDLPIPPEERPAWAHSWIAAGVWMAAVALLTNWGIRVFVDRFTAALSPVAD